MFGVDEGFSGSEDKVDLIVISVSELLNFLRFFEFFKDWIVFFFIVDLLMLSY